MVAPWNTPWVQLNDCTTRGTGVLRRPPKRMAEMGTPSGSFTDLESTGLLLIGAVKRELGCAAFSAEPRFHGRPCQSSASSGASPSIASHHTPPSLVSATLV